jgi:hypothetical protein
MRSIARVLLLSKWPIAWFIHFFFFFFFFSSSSWCDDFTMGISGLISFINSFPTNFVNIFRAASGQTIIIDGNAFSYAVFFSLFDTTLEKIGPDSSLIRSFCRVFLEELRKNRIRLIVLFDSVVPTEEKEETLLKRRRAKISGLKKICSQIATGAPDERCSSRNGMPLFFHTILIHCLVSENERIERKDDDGVIPTPLLEHLTLSSTSRKDPWLRLVECESEADTDIGRLLRAKAAHFVMSTDSDCVTFGGKLLLFHGMTHTDIRTLSDRHARGLNARMRCQLVHSSDVAKRMGLPSPHVFPYFALFCRNDYSGKISQEFLEFNVRKFLSHIASQSQPTSSEKSEMGGAHTESKDASKAPRKWSKRPVKKARGAASSLSGVEKHSEWFRSLGRMFCALSLPQRADPVPNVRYIVDRVFFSKSREKKDDIIAEFLTMLEMYMPPGSPIFIPEYSQIAASHLVRKFYLPLVPYFVDESAHIVGSAWNDPYFTDVRDRIFSFSNTHGPCIENIADVEECIERAMQLTRGPTLGDLLPTASLFDPHVCEDRMLSFLWLMGKWGRAQVEGSDAPGFKLWTLFRQHRIRECVAEIVRLSWNRWKHDDAERWIEPDEENPVFSSSSSRWSLDSCLIPSNEAGGEVDEDEDIRDVMVWTRWMSGFLEPMPLSHVGMKHTTFSSPSNSVRFLKHMAIMYSLVSLIHRCNQVCMRPLDHEPEELICSLSSNLLYNLIEEEEEE